MKYWSFTYEYHPSYHEYDYFREDSILYDIETTGLSKKYHFIYLIGCATREGNNITIHQFMAQSQAEETDIISSFFHLSKNYSNCITFNGKSFDEPFIIERAQKHQISISSYPKEHLDIYIACKSFKKLLGFVSCKQKMVEQFLGIYRDDIYQGGELIDVYHKYTELGQIEEEEVLKLHNFEDVKGLLPLLQILEYKKLGQDSPVITSSSFNKSKTINNTMQYEVLFSGNFMQQYPGNFRINTEHFYIVIDNGNIRGSLRLSLDTMYFFMKDYKKYVYLPDEDMVVLKELATMIPADRKKNATLDTCYIKKKDLFLWIPSTLLLTENIYKFKYQRKDKENYILFQEDLIDDTFISNYIHTIIKDLLPV